MAGSSWPALVAGSKARASDVEAKFDWIEGNIVPMLGGSQTDAAYDIGTSAARWRSGYFSTRLNVPALGLSDTSFLSFDATGTITANKPMKMTSGVAIDEFSSDGTLAGNSDLAVPTEKAVKTYVDNLDFVGGAVGANPGGIAYDVLFSGSGGIVLSTLSVTADTPGIYQISAQAQFGFTTTASPTTMAVYLEVMAETHTVGSTVPPGLSANAQGFFNTNTAIWTSHCNGFMTLTSGGHTFKLIQSATGANTASAYALVVRRISGA